MILKSECKYMCLASLPMYEREELKGPHKELWELICQGLIANSLSAPKSLVLGDSGTRIWEKKNLVLSQTCGFPFSTNLMGKVFYVGTPSYELKNCNPGYYRSVFIVNRNNKQKNVEAYINKKFAVNSFESQSGYVAACNYFSGGMAFNDIVVSGSHRNSAIMVSDGVVDIACLDDVSWQHIKKLDKFALDLVEISRTDPTPGLPFITVKYGDHVDLLYSVIKRAISKLSAKSTSMLLLTGLSWIDPKEYYKVPYNKKLQAIL